MKFAAFQNPAVFQTLDKLFKAKVPVKTAYRLSKVQKIVAAESEKYNELRLDVIKKFSTLDASGEPQVDEAGNVQIKSDIMPAFMLQINDLHDIEIDLTEKFTLEELEGVELTAYELGLLEALELLDVK